MHWLQTSTTLSPEENINAYILLTQIYFFWKLIWEKRKKLNNVFKILRNEIRVWDKHNYSQLHQIEASEVSILRSYLSAQVAEMNWAWAGCLCQRKSGAASPRLVTWNQTLTEWLYSCQEVTLFLRIQRAKEGILEATAVGQTDLPLSLIQPG